MVSFEATASSAVAANVSVTWHVEFSLRTIAQPFVIDRSVAAASATWSDAVGAVPLFLMVKTLVTGTPLSVLGVHEVASIASSGCVPTPESEYVAGPPGFAEAVSVAVDDADFGVYATTKLHGVAPTPAVQPLVAAGTAKSPPAVKLGTPETMVPWLTSENVADCVVPISALKPPKVAGGWMRSAAGVPEMPVSVAGALPPGVPSTDSVAVCRPAVVLLGEKCTP